jgi:hypothetical protein
MATTHPNDEIPVLGLNPPSDAISMFVGCDNISAISCSSIKSIVLVDKSVAILAAKVIVG